MLATVYKGNIIKNLIMDCQSYTKYRPNETTGGIFNVSWRRKEQNFHGGLTEKLSPSFFHAKTGGKCLWQMIKPKTLEQPVTDSGPGKETPPAPPKANRPKKVSVSLEPGKKTEPEVKNPQVSVYNFAEIMKEKKAEERAATPGVEKPDPAKVEKPEKQPETPKKAEEKPKEPEQPKRRGRPPKADKDKAAAPKSRWTSPAQGNRKRRSKRSRRKSGSTVQTASHYAVFVRRNPKSRRMHHAGARKSRSSISSCGIQRRLYARCAG